MIIRKEIEANYVEVNALLKQAFKIAEGGEQGEHDLVRRLRKSEAFVPELSIVAEKDGKIVGHALLTKIKIGDNISLAFAPLSVLPEYQGEGIGGELIKAAHATCKKAGFTSVILLGHPNYYPRFGYIKASDFGITCPFPVPQENFFAIELEPGALSGISGAVEYAKEFFE